MKEKVEKTIDINLEDARECLIELMPMAGEISKKYFESGGFSSRSKGGVDFTTEVDEKIDEFLRINIKRKFPQSSFLTEETAPDSYYKLTKAKNLWVIDSIDGTNNFERKRDHFGISVALVSKGIPLVGCVLLPIQNELYMATKDSKTLLNGKEIQVSKTDSLQRAWLESGISWDMEKREEFAKNWIPKIVQKLRAFTMSGSTVFDMAKVAEGQVDGFFYCGIKPWDQAATGLLIQNAGGIITTAEGKAWNIFERDIVATNGLIHDQVLELISKN